LKITHYIHPSPVICQCYKLIKEEKNNNYKRNKGEDLVNDRQAVINKIVNMAQAVLKIYVASFSKNFIKDLCYAMELNGMGDKIQDYTADTNEKTKREDMKNVKAAWKKFQVVAVTGTVGAGINFSEKHFDVTFAIIGQVP